MKSKLLMITIILTIIVILPISFGLPKKKENTEIEGSLRKYVQIDNLIVVEQEGLWTVTAEIENKTNKDIYPSSFLFLTYDEKKREIFHANIEIGATIHAGEKKQFSITTPTNLTNITTFHYEIEGSVAK